MKYLLIALLMFGCVKDPSKRRRAHEREQSKKEPRDRIQGRMSTPHYKTGYALIITVDGHEYLGLTRGGIIHLRSCKAGDGGCQ